MNRVVVSSFLECIYRSKEFFVLQYIGKCLASVGIVSSYMLLHMYIQLSCPCCFYNQLYQRGLQCYKSNPLYNICSNELSAHLAA